MKQALMQRSVGRPQLGGYWQSTATFALLMVATVGMRIQEGIPYAPLIRPAALAAYGGGFLVLTQTSGDAIRSAFQDRTLRLALLYFGWMWVTVPTALWMKLALQTALIGVPAAFMVFSILLCRPERQTLRKVLIGFCVAAGVSGLLALRAGVTFGGAEDRLTTDGSLDSNDLAAIMAFALPFAIGLVRRERGKFRWIGIALVVLCATVIVRTVSRGGVLAMVVGLLVYTLGMPGTRKYTTMAVLAFLAAAAWPFTPQPFRDRMQTINSEDDYNYTAYTGRKQIWARGRGYIKSHPLLGVGAGNFEIAEGDYAKEVGKPAKWSAAHNAYLQAFAELGIIGGSLFVALLLVTARRAWRMFRAVPGVAPDWHRPELLAATCAFAASAYFLSHAYFYPFFAICAITALADRARILETRRGPARDTVPVRVSGWRTAASLARVRRLPATPA
jgi:O-antigen ligase